ncbi:DUF3298 domain-containing protein [Hymenobacter sp. B81]|uniref:DUF3298 and DUF4163 domain-containing protein n=1 Tax=Hymenobacter sp. B81 TaxID=3344878 RepID=UPI0037DC2265
MSRPFLPPYCAAALALLLSACNSRSDQSTSSTETAPPAAAAAQAPAAATDSPGAWYRQYRGLLPGTADSITLHLQAWPRLSNDTESAGVAASYAGPDGQPFELMGDYESPARADSLVLIDYEPEHQTGPDNRGIVWRLRRQGSSLRGTVGGRPVQLRERQPAGSLRLASRFLHDSVAAFPGQARSPHAQLRLLALLPTGPGAATATLAANLLRHLRGDTVETRPAPSIDSLWRQQVRRYAVEYRQDAAGSRPAPGDTASYPAGGLGLRYDDQQLMRVLWNQAPLLSVGFFSYGYTGGAHGNYNTRVQTYDTRTGRPLRFADIFRAGSKPRLVPLLDQAARRAFRLAPGAPLDGPLFEKHLPATDNVFLTSGGAVFVYAPYEVACYAQGEIRLFVPFAELSALLKPGLPVGNQAATAAR